MNSEQKKFIFALVLICGAVVAAFWLWPQTPALSDTLTFVCIETGEVFRVARDDVPYVLPMENPKTGRRTLLPAHEEGGKLKVGARHASVLDQPEFAKVNRYVDPQTYEVLESPRE
jgi:hypothetical protein